MRYRSSSYQNNWCLLMEHNGTEKTNFDFDRNSHYFIRDVVGGAFSDNPYIKIKWKKISILLFKFFIRMTLNWIIKFDKEEFRHYHCVYPRYEKVNDTRENDWSFEFSQNTSNVFSCALLFISLYVMYYFTPPWFVPELCLLCVWRSLFQSRKSL